MVFIKKNPRTLFFSRRILSFIILNNSCSHIHICSTVEHIHTSMCCHWYPVHKHNLRYTVCQSHWLHHKPLHFSMPLISWLKLTPILYSFRLSEMKGNAYCLSWICFNASSAVPFSLNSMT